MPITQVITTLPTAPDPATMTPDEFSAAAAASVLAQKAMIPEINTWTTQVNSIVSGTAGDIASGINGATAKTTPVDADLMCLTDSAASWVLKKLTWANLKATLGSTFAALAGSSSYAFSVGTATSAAHAVRADQFQDGLPSVYVQHNTPSSGLITFTLNPGLWHFRSSSLYDGSPIFRPNALALTLATDNIGASFGATSGIQTRLYLLVIDDGTGDPVLGVTLGKGLKLDETNLIDATSTISGAVNSDAAIYTTVALSAGAYAYKVAAVFDAVWTNGAGWNAIPVLVQCRDNTTLHYAEGTFIATMSGCSSYTQQTQTIRWVKNGKQITLSGEGAAMSGTSNAATKPLAGLPQILWPAQTRNIMVTCQDNGGSFVAAAAIISPTGTITCFANINTNSFTASGTASVDVFGVSYVI